jgi:hypothetical protein
LQLNFFFTASHTELPLNWQLSTKLDRHLFSASLAELYLNGLSKSHCDWRSAPSGAHDQIFITVWHLRSCFCGAPSLTGGRVCLLYTLLALVSAVFLGSKSLGVHDHILLSQVWDFPLCCLLRLAGSQWRYSTPPPRRFSRLRTPDCAPYNSSELTPRKTPSSVLNNACLLFRYLAMDVLLLRV